MNLLRDSASLQTHLRLFENLVETRHTILRLRPNQRQNWLGLAVAHHLNGNLEDARKVLEHYLHSLKVRLSFIPLVHMAHSSYRMSLTTMSSNQKRSCTIFPFWRVSETIPKHSRNSIKMSNQGLSLVEWRSSKQGVRINLLSISNRF